MAAWGSGTWGDSGWGGFVAYDSTIAETSTGADAVVSALAVNPVVSETGTGTDTLATSKLYSSD